jgi:hypothetical protein
MFARGGFVLFDLIAVMTSSCATLVHLHGDDTCRHSPAIAAKAPDHIVQCLGCEWAATEIKGEVEIQSEERLMTHATPRTPQ